MKDMDRFRRNNNTISGRLKDEIVIMDIDRGKYFTLNPVATRIWDLLENSLTQEEICNILINEYEVDFKQCIREVQEVMTELVDSGLIIRDEK
jgi:hypothetical protein